MIPIKIKMLSFTGTNHIYPMMIIIFIFRGFISYKKFKVSKIGFYIWYLVFNKNNKNNKNNINIL